MELTEKNTGEYCTEKKGDPESIQMSLSSGIATATPTATSAAPKRHLYLDFLRILACFLVIVNHTNSHVFQAASPANFTWYLSIMWYYFSKIAVPLFIMVSGACLLPRQDSYRRTGQRILRMALVLVLFSYLYYLWNVWLEHWTWARVFDFGGFLSSIWRERITDSFWYLYFYIGLLVMLPVFQRMAKSMRKRDLQYFLCVCFGLGSLWPLITHYVPALELAQYFDPPMVSVLVGLFFAGHYLHVYGMPGFARRQMTVGAAVTLFMLLLSTALTALEFSRVMPGGKYWFMDERSTPALPVVVCAMAVMLMAKAGFGLHQVGATDPAARPRNADESANTDDSASAGKLTIMRNRIRRSNSKNSKLESPPSRRGRFLPSLGSCAFTIYLLQDWLIAETRYRVFVPLCSQMNPFLAGLIWSFGIFAVLLTVALGLRRMPLLRKIL